MNWPPAVDTLIQGRRLQEIIADADRARARLAEAKQHVGTARLALDHDDPIGAYQLAYDAARKAVDGHMLARGLRATNSPGAHQAVVAYAEAMLGATEVAVEIAHLDRMRRKRNKAEYDQIHLGRAEVEGAIHDATRIVETIGALLT